MTRQFFWGVVMQVSRETAPHYIWGKVCDGWILSQSEALSVIYERMPPGSGEKRHYHTKARQFFFVLSGTLTMEMGGEVYPLAAQSGIEIPPGAPHQARNESDADIEFLVISTPTTQGDRVDDDLVVTS